MTIEKATFNKAEGAKYLGLSTTVFSRLLKSGKIKHIRVGRRILITKNSLDSFLEKG